MISDPKVEGLRRYLIEVTGVSEERSYGAAYGVAKIFMQDRRKGLKDMPTDDQEETTITGAPGTGRWMHVNDPLMFGKRREEFAVWINGFGPVVSQGFSWAIGQDSDKPHIFTDRDHAEKCAAEMLDQFGALRISVLAAIQVRAVVEVVGEWQVAESCISQEDS